jgi:hypothetical protein
VIVTLYNDNGSVYLPATTICVSSGTLDIQTDTFEINNNCHAGWKLKFPALSGATMSFTGQMATTPANIALGSGKRAYINYQCGDSDGGTPIAWSCDAYLTGLSITLDVNEAVNCDMTFEMSGAPDGGSILLVATP